MMDRIRSSNTKPKILTRKILHKIGYGFRLNSKAGIIKPDIVLKSHKVDIFIHGYYQHQYEDCKLAYSDRNRTESWRKKFTDNRGRNKRVTEQLLQQDWRVVVIWECLTRNQAELEKEINNIDK